MKKIFAIVIALAMVLTMITVPAMAETKSSVPASASMALPRTAQRDAATLDEALNVEGGTLVFTNDATYPWVIAGDAAQSGNAGVASSTSSITTTVTAEEGNIVQFDYKAWGEGSDTSDWDKCRFYVDNNMLMDYGEHQNDWETFAAELTAGEHTLTWTYKKDGSVNPTGDYFMVDNVYVGEPAQPTSIEVEDVTVPAGRRVTVVYEVLPAEAFNKNVTFETADTGIATVDANGNVTGVAEGTTTITVTSVADPTVSGEATVTVTEALPTVNLYGYATYDIGETYDSQWVEFPDYDPSAYVGHGAMDGTFAAAFAGGNVYGFTYDSNAESGIYYIMDAETYEVSFIDNPAAVFGMAYNYANNTMYCISGTDTRSLATVDLATGTVTDIAAFTGYSGSAIMTLAIDGEGNAYGLDLAQPATLYSIDLETAVCTAIGSTGVDLNYVQSMTFDIETNQLYWAQIYSLDSHGLYVIDTETGAASFLGTIGSAGAEITGLYTKNDIEIPDIEMPEVEITFVDGLDNSVIDTMTVEAGTVLEEADFPEAPAHAGFEFTGWDYNGAAVYTDTTITAMYRDPNATIWDFETDPEAQGFQFVDQDGDGNNWEWRYGEDWADFNFHEGLGYMMSASYVNNVGALTPDNWMITPAFTGSRLTFWAQGQDPSWASEYLGVFVSTDGGQTWSDELVGWTLDGNDTQYTVDLTDYADTEIVLAIRHYNVTDMFNANVDYIELTTSGTTPVEPELLGDVDGDGEVTMSDALLVLRYRMGLIELSDAQLAVADVNGDGEVTIDDAILILRYAMGLIETFPAEPELPPMD